MHRTVTTCLAVVTLVSGIVAAAQTRPGLPANCRQQIFALCGSDRTALRACLREHVGELDQACRTAMRDTARDRRAGSAVKSASATVLQSVAYGSDPRQAIDFYPARNPAAKPPLVLFVHGGGWSFGDRTRTVQHKPAHFVGQGYAFASTGYRLLPTAPVELQATDIGDALKALRQSAASLGFDADRIVLMGHSAGAHLAALVATDPRYAGEAFGSIKAVVLLDGAGYDVPATMAHDDMELPALYRSAFGTDVSRQRKLSPITHVGGPDAPDWLVLHVAERARSRDMSVAFSKALESAGARSTVVAVDGTDHGRLNRELGTDGDFATSRVDAFLAALLP